MTSLSSTQKKWAIDSFFMLVVLSVIGYFLSNLQSGLAQQNIASGFSFMSKEAGFDLSESMISFGAEDTYLRAFGVGILNTLKVAVIGNILAIFLGVVVGIGLLSDNWLQRTVCEWYVNLLRNIPLLLQLFFWYAVFTEIFPHVRLAMEPVPGFFISQRGINFPMPVEGQKFLFIFFSFLFALGLSFGLGRYQRNQFLEDGIPRGNIYFSLGIVIVLPFICWLVLGFPTEFVRPKLQGFNMKGGGLLGPEFISLLAGLVFYTSSYNAEIVRSGIQSIKKGQWEAAKSLGLSYYQTFTLIILPQALRVIIPPITSQILNLTKNSSLSIAIAYPDFVAVANTAMNQTGQAVEVVFLIMLVYLFFSLTSSIFMNWFNKRARIY
jgi:general L-amino acid transport system permease protein